MAHWQIYHIDQHTSRIVCEHRKDGNRCHYMTDRKADMKTHVHKQQLKAVQDLQSSNIYVN